MSVFSVVLIICGVLVISALNSVHSVLWLIGGFTSAIVLLIILEVDFMALIFIIVYVGAIAILFLFVIMMLNLADFRDLLDMSNSMLAGFIIGMGLFLEVFIYFSWGFQGLSGGVGYWRWDFIERSSNIEGLGGVIYTNYAYFFILACWILLVAMVGAIILTFSVRNEIKRQEIFIQISR